VLPDDGPVRPKHVGVINFNVLISVNNFESVKYFRKKRTLVQIVGLIIYISRSIARYNNGKKIICLRLYLQMYWNCVLEQTSDVDR